MEGKNLQEKYEQTGIKTYYSGDFGEIRHSRFYSLRKDFSDKSTLSFKYVLNGQEKYIIEGKKFEINAKQVLFFSENKPYQGFINYPTLTKGLCIDLNIDLKKHAQMDALNEDELFFFSPEFKTQKINFLNNTLHNLLHMIEEYGSDQNFRLEEILQEVSLFVLNMEREYTERIQSIPAKNKSYKKELFSRLISAKNFIHENKKQKISLKKIATEAGLSAFYLHRLFKQTFGYTPAQFQEEIRMKEAKGYLKSLSVKETSYAVGFTDEAYFSKRFKKYFGISPGRFSRQIS